MLYPNVVWKCDNTELWLFRHKYFQAVKYSDGVVQLFLSNAQGLKLSKHSIHSHNMHDYQATIKWLNENVK